MPPRVLPWRECGCTPYFTQHNHWCKETPIYAQLVKDFGNDPTNMWPFIVFALIAPNKGDICG